MIWKQICKIKCFVRNCFLNIHPLHFIKTIRKTYISSLKRKKLFIKHLLHAAFLPYCENNHKKKLKNKLKENK
jgi:hypothetical protein